MRDVRPPSAARRPAPPDPPAFTRTGPPLATGQPKFLGSAHSPGNASLNFGAYWNQVTPENGGKWGTAQPQSPFGPADQGYPPLPNPAFNFAQARLAYDQARANGHVFKWHVLFWGNQQPGWIETLPVAKQEEAIRIWLAAIAREFPDLEQIEVVNEPLHDPPRGPTNGNYIEALGGDNGLYGTGWDWIIRAFELAREYFPNAQLMLNDFSITNDGNATTRYLEIIELLKARGLIDLVGVQGHAFEYNYNNLPGSAATHTANLARLAATELPIYVTEFDIDGIDPAWGLQDDAAQLARYQALFPVFWESEHVHGVTALGLRARRALAHEPGCLAHVPERRRASRSAMAGPLRRERARRGDAGAVVPRGREPRGGFDDRHGGCDRRRSGYDALAVAAHGSQRSLRDRFEHGHDQPGGGCDARLRSGRELHGRRLGVRRLPAQRRARTWPSTSTT